jgi:integrase
MRGSVYKIEKGKHAGRWYAEVRARVGRKQFRQAAQFPTKKTAEAQRAKWCELVDEALAAHRLGIKLETDPAACPTFDALCSEWLAGADVRATTRDGYERHINLHLTPFFGGLEPPDITLRHLRRFRTLLQRGHSPEGTKRIEATLRSVLTYAERGGLIDRNPCRDLSPVRPPKGAGNETWRVFTEAEVSELVDAADDAWAAWFLLAARTGMRSGELRALRWADIDLQDGWVTVARRASWVIGAGTWDVGPPKSGNGRRIPLSADAVSRLTRWPRTLGNELVFPARDGGYRRDWRVRNALKRAMKVAGVEGHAKPHDFRHSFASHLLRLGADVETVRRLGGWSSLDMVLRYVHTGEDTMVEAVRRLGQGG